MTPWHQMFLDLIEQHIQAGDECILITCTGSLPICYVNQQHKLSYCYLCKHRFKQGLKWLSSKVVVDQLGNLTRQQRSKMGEILKLDFATTEAIKAFELDGSDVGSAAVSSTISTLREPWPSYVEHKELIHKNLETAILVHYSLNNLLEAYNPDKLILFNGRIATQRPALRMGVARHVETLALEESWGSPNSYIFTRDSYIHNVNKFSVYLNDTFEKSNLSEADKVKEGLGFFDEQRKNRFASKNDLTLEDVNFSADGCKIVTIFNSSEDEFVCIPEFKNPFYKSQEEGLIRIIGDLLALGSVKVILRVHPNLRGIENTQTNAIKKIAGMFKEGLIVFEAESRIDSYHLIERSDIVVTFGSTTGVEAAYSGKTSVLMARSFYESLRCIMRPKSHADFIAFVEKYHPGELEPSALSRDERLRELAKYGFFMRSFGYKAKFRKTYGSHRDEKSSLIKNGVETFLDVPLTHRIYPIIKKSMKRVMGQ